MKKIALAAIALFALSFTAVSTSAAVKYKIPGIFISQGSSSGTPRTDNDLPYERWVFNTARTFGTTDTVFGVAVDTSGKNKFNNSDFQTTRVGNLVSTNPDSVVCKALIKSIDADSETFVFGINDSLSGSTGWTTYGGTATTSTVLNQGNWVTTRTTIPWTGATFYKPFITVSTATDTLSLGYMDCKIINRN